jgi:hypothetical protein
MFFSSTRKGNPLTGLAFYDKFSRVILQVGKEGYANKTLKLAEDERILGFRSAGQFMSLPDTHINF